MLAFDSSIPSKTYAYLLNCRMEAPIYNKLESFDRNSNWIVFQALFAFVFASSINAVTKVSAVAEVIILGLANLLVASFSENRAKHLRLGAHLLQDEVPRNIINACVFFPIEIILDFMLVFANPMYLIISKSESLKVNLKHAEANTIQTLEHNRDLLRAYYTIEDRVRKYESENL